MVCTFCPVEVDELKSIAVVTALKHVALRDPEVAVIFVLRTVYHNGTCIHYTAKVF